MKSVRLDPELEKKLKRTAEATGKTESAVIREAVSEYCDSRLDEEPEPPKKTLQDFIGCLDLGYPTDASNIKEEVGKIIEEKFERKRAAYRDSD
jgi:Arc/MetJ-type ribon-helix-helix transcriptional regulator